jgi:chromosome segregation ATPase|tara:strand:+ start:184 stop:567 length:384 start_codon:yes stop_codon:yes gene_type:complete
MGYKERVVYILKIIVLICIVAWLLFTDRERYVEEYNAKIEALEQKVDSLHGINDELTFKIDTLNTQIKGLDKEISLKNSRINNLKYEISTKVDAVDDFNDDELERFFTERYRELLDSIAKTNSETSN